jgi:hypothetical protein
MINAYNRLYSFVNDYKMPSPQEKLCLECQTAFKGRIDKKFCSDTCRVAYNNRLNSDDINYVRNVNNILRRNRRILMALNPEGKNRVSQDKLKSQGFNFNYFTSTYITKEGARYFYCYEQGYLPLEKEKCLLVIKKDFN